MASRAKREPKFKDLFRLEARQDEIQADLDKIFEEAHKAKKAAAGGRAGPGSGKPEGWRGYGGHPSMQAQRADRQRTLMEEISLPR